MGLLERRTGTDGGTRRRSRSSSSTGSRTRPNRRTSSSSPRCTSWCRAGRKSWSATRLLLRPSQYLAVSLELPVAHVVEASPEEPYLCMTLSGCARARGLDRRDGRPVPRDDHDGRALYVSPSSAATRRVSPTGAAARYAAGHPGAGAADPAGAALPAAAGRAAGRLAEIAIGDGRLRRVAGAIAFIKEHYAEPLQIEALAKRVNMSPSALHATSRRSRR